MKLLLGEADTESGLQTAICAPLHIVTLHTTYLPYQPVSRAVVSGASLPLWSGARGVCCPTSTGELHAGSTRTSLQ